MMGLFEEVHEMKDVLNGITTLNLLGTEQILLPIPTDLISRNADEINENDEVSQSVNHTHDKSDISHNLANMSNYAWESIRSLPLKKLLSILCSTLVAQHSNKCAS
jgi:hypothetical protein